jgi:hypothetical protein
MTKTFPFLSARLLLALPLAGLGAQAVQAQAPSPAAVFNTVITYPTTGGPVGIATADLNGDGNLDVVTIGGSRAGVQFGSGTGAFGAPTLYLTGTSGALVSGPSSLALADITGDGVLDIVVANSGTFTIAVLAGTGTGTFGASTTYTTGNNRPGRLAVADVNRDGKLDVVAISGTSNVVVSVLLNTGAGALGAPTTYAASTGFGNTPTNLALADVNRDGNPDVLTTNSDSNGSGVIGVLLGTGTGAFGAVATLGIGAGARPASIAAADLNGDGNPDLVVANGSQPGASNTSRIAVLLGTGTGTFGAATNYNAGLYGNTGVVLIDLNGDGNLDVVTANSSNDTASALLGTGTGSFGAPLISDTGKSGQPRDLAVADVNNDGRPDLLTADYSSNTLSVLLGVATPLPDLVINTAVTVPAGTYNNITVNSPGVATLGGTVTVNQALVVNAGATLNDGCNIVGGPGSFTLAAGGTLGICNPNGISSSIFSGSLDGAVRLRGGRSFSSDATYIYNGTADQRTGNGLPSQVSRLTINNPTNVYVSSPTGVSQVLTLAGTGNLYSGGNQLTLLSSAAGTALLVSSSTFTFNGNSSLTVQRYIDPSKNSGSGYRHFSSPVSNTTVGDLSTTTSPVVVNPAYNTAATPPYVYPFPTVFGYDQALVNRTNSSPAFDKGFFSPNNTNDPLVPGRGYAVQVGASQLVDFVGVPNQGTITVAASRNAAGTLNDQAAGWQFLGNPYPSPLDLSRLTSADYPSFDAAVYVQESTRPYTGMYRTYVNGIGNPLLASCQGFFMRVSAPGTSTSFTFRNAQRVTTFDRQATFYRPAADPRPLVQLALSAANGEADTFFAYAESGATAAFDGQYDAAKLPNASGLNLSSTAASGENLSIDGSPAFAAATVLPLAVGVPAAGTYSLSAADLAKLPAGLVAYLTDAQTGQLVPLSVGSSYRFGVSAAEAQGVISGRFSLIFRPATALAATPSLRAAEVAVYPNPTRADFTVVVPAVAGAATMQAELCNALGQVVRRQAAALPATGATLRVPTGGLAAGVYVLRLQAGAATIARRVVVQ